LLVGTGKDKGFQAIGALLPILHEGAVGQIASALLFLALAAVLARQAQKRIM